MGATFVELHVKRTGAEAAPPPDGFEPLPHPGSGWTAFIRDEFLEAATIRALVTAASAAGTFACALGVWDSDRLELMLARNGEFLSGLVYEPGERPSAQAAFQPWGELLDAKQLAQLKRLLKRREVSAEDKLPELAALFGWGGYPPPVVEKWERVEGPARLGAVEGLTGSVPAKAGEPFAAALHVQNAGGPQRGCRVVLTGDALRERRVEVRSAGGLPVDVPPSVDGRVEVALPEFKWEAGSRCVAVPPVRPARDLPTPSSIPLVLLAHREGEVLLRGEVSAEGADPVQVDLRAHVTAPPESLDWAQRYGRNGHERSLSGVLVLGGPEASLPAVAEELARSWLELIGARSGLCVEFHPAPTADGADGKRVNAASAQKLVRERLLGATALLITTRAAGQKAGKTGDSGFAFQWSAREADGTRLLHVGFWRDIWGQGAAECEALRAQAASAIDAAFERGGGVQGVLGIWDFRPRWPLEPTPPERAAGLGGPDAQNRAALSTRVKAVAAEGLWLGRSFEETFARLSSLRPAVEVVPLAGGVRVVLRDPSSGPAVEATVAQGVIATGKGPTP